MTALDGRHVPVVVVGAGQAGLSTSWHLTDAGVEHVVLEKDRVAQEWRSSRWDSFCLVTPNWQCRLPGFPYDGDDPDGFMVKDEIVAYLERYVASFRPPVHEGVRVLSCTRQGEVLALTTTAGDLTADAVVVATGCYQVPVVPAWAADLPADLVQLHSQEYRNPGQLPPGEVLVVGSGQSGAQIAEDLHLAGRRVHLCLGDAPRVARRYRGKDVVAWLDELGYYRTTVDQKTTRDGEAARANHYVTGRDGGRDIDLRAFARDGMRLYGLLTDLVDGELRFRQDLRRSLDFADETSEAVKDVIDAHIAAQGIDAPAEPRYVPVWEPETEPTSLQLEGSGITSVLWCIGFRADHSWLQVPVLDEAGRVLHARGVSPDPSVCFVGLTWQWTWGSARMSGVGEDARHVVEHLLAGPVGRRSPLTAGSR
ncbi:MAG: putative monooxygenase [Frankiales bacterium]|nr:putative monooxygenase [Frankiales bacterium]